MASKVMSMSEPAVQKETEEQIQTKPVAKGINPLAEMSVSPPRERLQRRPSSNFGRSSHQSFYSNFRSTAYYQRNNQPAQKPENTVQPPTTDVQKESEEQIQTKPLAEGITPVVQRAAVGNENVQANSNLESRLNSSKGGGNPLPNQVQSFMEPRFGADFSQVRVHTDNTAVQMNRDLGAQAFTHGSDIYYSEGKAPGQNELTAHELTHVVQQGGAKTLNQEVQTKPQPKTTNFNKEVRLFPDSQTPAAKQIPEINESLTNKEPIPLHQKIENYNPETPIQTKKLTSGVTPISKNLVQEKSFLEKIPGGKWIKEQLDRLGKLGQLLIKHLYNSLDVMRSIATNPKGFIDNLVIALRQGLQSFIKNIAGHLQAGFVAWLTGGLGVRQQINLNSPQGIFNLAMGLYSPKSN
jgi:hypothetical protein